MRIRDNDVRLGPRETFTENRLLKLISAHEPPFSGFWRLHLEDGLTLWADPRGSWWEWHNLQRSQRQ